MRPVVMVARKFIFTSAERDVRHGVVAARVVVIERQRRPRAGECRVECALPPILQVGDAKCDRPPGMSVCITWIELGSAGEERLSFHLPVAVTELPASVYRSECGPPQLAKVLELSLLGFRPYEVVSKYLNSERAMGVYLFSTAKHGQSIPFA